MNSPFTTEDKITLMEAFCTIPVCAVLGVIAALVGLFFGWTMIGMLALSIGLTLVFSLTPLAGMLRRWVRGKAERYYYGT
jgi:hypothetical protein